jgi:hypothetical protein
VPWKNKSNYLLFYSLCRPFADVFDILDAELAFPQGFRLGQAMCIATFWAGRRHALCALINNVFRWNKGWD